MPVALIAVILPFDIVTKNLIVRNFGFGERADFVGGFLRIALVYNEGGVFGILQGHKNLFLAVSAVVLTLMVLYYIFEKNKTALFSISMGLIVTGAIGNIIDRVIPGRPGVVDFISVGVDGVYRWPSFNIADSSIVVGACLLIIVFYREERKRKKQAAG
ncbi:MAG: signal peptidase II [Spirochaetes bacterium RBG_13_51_14]|nr:MAG: signal peptidase II [Spirochaetes bacterium RBG_13_51_14]